MNILLFLWFSMLVPTLASAEHDWKNQIENFKKIVVNIKTRTEMGLGFDLTGTTSASGFIVDAKKRILATNRHVTQTSPATYEVQFFDGTKTKAKLLYYDPWHDFAFLQFDPLPGNFQIVEAKLGKHANLQNNDEVCMIGNNEVEAYSIKYGRISKLFVNKLSEDFERHTHALLTSFDRAGGSSGSPVFNINGEVIAIHKAGNSTSSYELRIDYLSDALQALEKDQTPKRGEIGIKLRTLPISSATRFYHYPQAEIDQLKRKNPDLQNVLQISRTLPDSEAGQKLKVGDLLVSINNTSLNEDVYLADHLINESVGKPVTLQVFRNSNKMSISLTPKNAEKQKIDHFVEFGGTLFHSISPTQGIYFNIPSDGIYLTETDLGSSFEWVGNFRRGDPAGLLKKRKVIIYEANGKTLHNLDDLISVFSKLKPGDPLAMVITDIYEDGLQKNVAEVELSENLSTLKQYRWNSSAHKWE